MSTLKTFCMRSVAVICCCLALLLTGLSCGKSTIGHKVEGDWRLVHYGGPSVPQPLRPGPEILSLHYNTYTVKYGSYVAASGTYRIGWERSSLQPVLYFSGQEYGSGVGFDKDTLVLTYTGIMPAIYTAIVSKYVRI